MRAFLGHHGFLVWNMCCAFPYIGNNNPNGRTHIFQRGRYTTNQIIYIFFPGTARRFSCHILNSPDKERHRFVSHVALFLLSSIVFFPWIVCLLNLQSICIVGDQQIELFSYTFDFYSANKDLVSDPHHLIGA